MSYAQMADSQLRKAFTLLKDLAREATLTRKSVGAFNFATGSAVVTSDAPVVTKVIPTSKEKLSRDRKTITMDVMLRSRDVGSVTGYATMVVDGVTWRFGAPIKDTGFILLTTVFREA